MKVKLLCEIECDACDERAQTTATPELEFHDRDGYSQSAPGCNTSSANIVVEPDLPDGWKKHQDDRWSIPKLLCPKCAPV